MGYSFLLFLNLNFYINYLGKELINYVNDNWVITQTQYSYMKNHRTETTLLSFFRDILTILDSGYKSSCIIRIVSFI